jgi:hypothetical protein
MPWAPQEKTWSATIDYNTEYNMHGQKSIHNHIRQQYQDDRKRTFVTAAILSESVSFRGTHSLKRLNDLSVAEAQSRCNRFFGHPQLSQLLSFPVTTSTISRFSSVSLAEIRDGVVKTVAASETERLPSAESFLPVKGAVSGLLWHCQLIFTLDT